MKIAMISEHANPLADLGTTDAGGQNVHVAALSEALVRAGHGVCVYTRRTDPLAQTETIGPGGFVVRLIDAGPPKPIPKDDIYGFVDAFAAGVRRWFAVESPDVVHAHFWMSALVAARVCPLLRVPFAITFHALGGEKRMHQGTGDSSPASRIDDERRLACAADRVIATTSSEIFELCRMGAEPRRLRIVPCGVDTAFFSSGEPYALPRRFAHRIVTLSRLVPRKGVDDAIVALRDVPDSELLVAGGDERVPCDARELARLREVALVHGVAERTFFVGRLGRAAIPGFLRSADALVSAGWYEPFGIVPLEAMACGVPVVATSVGGQKDTVIDGYTGFHVSPRSPKAISAALSTLVASPSLRARFGAAGRYRVAERYTWTQIAAETLRVYRSIERTATTSIGHSA